MIQIGQVVAVFGAILGSMVIAIAIALAEMSNTNVPPSKRYPQSLYIMLSLALPGMFATLPAAYSQLLCCQPFNRTKRASVIALACAFTSAGNAIAIGTSLVIQPKEYPHGLLKPLEPFLWISITAVLSLIAGVILLFILKEANRWLEHYKQEVLENVQVGHNGGRWTVKGSEFEDPANTFRFYT